MTKADSGFRFSQRSLERLQGVHPDLVRVAHKALARSEVDFGVTEGRRSRERQAELVASGASTTMNSRHLTGHAIDLVAYVGGSVSWDWPLYYKLADAMKSAAAEEGVDLEWGGAWGRDLQDFENAHQASDDYTAERRGEGRRPFLDGPHFQLSWQEYPA